MDASIRSGRASDGVLQVTSPSTKSEDRLVAITTSCGQLRTSEAIARATVSETCSQLSTIRTADRGARYSIRLTSGPASG